MAKIIVLWLSLLVLLTGCAPKDPLERKVRAGTPDELSRWWDRVEKKLPEAERKEVYDLVRFLQDSTPRLKAMTAENTRDPLCKQIDGMSVRELMIFAYQENNRQIRRRLMIETGKLTPLVTASSTATDERSRERADAMLKYTNRVIESWNEKIAANSRRIGELETPASR